MAQINSRFALASFSDVSLSRNFVVVRRHDDLTETGLLLKRSSGMQSTSGAPYPTGLGGNLYC